MAESTIPWIEDLFLACEKPLLLMDAWGNVVRQNLASKSLPPPSSWIPKPAPPFKDSFLVDVGNATGPVKMLWIPIPVDAGEAEGDTALIGSAIPMEKTVQELEEADRRKNLFLSFVAHEMRTPISSVVSWSELLQSKMLKTDDEQTEAFQILVTESQRLAGLLTKILNFFRLESGRNQLDIRWVSMDQLLQKVVQDMDELAAEKGITVFVEDNTGDAKFQGDQGLLALALANLIENSILYSPKDSEVLLTATQAGAWFRISLHDVGCGIPAELIQQLMEPYHLPSQHLRRRTGIGLGIPTAAEVMRRHGGGIEIESSPKGTLVTVTLPSALASSSLGQ